MRYHRLIALAVGVTLYLSASASAEELRMSRSLAQYLVKVQISVVNGRIAVAARAPEGKITSNSTEHTTKRTEQLIIDLTTGSPAIHYESSDAALRIIVDLADSQRLSIRRTVLNESPTAELEFDQLPGTPLRLVVADDAGRRTYEARSIWHLLLAEPQVCQRDLIPLVELIHPSFQLREQATKLEQFLAEWARQQRRADDIRWSDLIAQLASPTYAERRAADRTLRRAGERALPVLEGLDLVRLDVEQRIRIRQIIADLSVLGADTPARIGLRLSADPQIWLAILSSSDAAHRTAAIEQLRKLIAEPVEFDPNADQAVRDAQIEKLRRQLMKSG